VTVSGRVTIYGQSLGGMALKLLAVVQKHGLEALF
jgi:DNA-binding transcriptional regulator YiaG